MSLLNRGEVSFSGIYFFTIVNGSLLAFLEILRFSNLETGEGKNSSLEIGELSKNGEFV